jgi:hypothetical protein
MRQHKPLDAAQRHILLMRRGVSSLARRRQIIATEDELRLRREASIFDLLSKSECARLAHGRAGFRPDELQK